MPCYKSNNKYTNKTKLLPCSAPLHAHTTTHVTKLNLRGIHLKPCH